MKLSIFGAGYVGLVTAACFAELGNDVVCCDIDAKRIDLLHNGVIPIYEPGLEDLVRRNVADGRLSFTDDSKAAIAFGSIVFIAVGTPSTENGGVDMKFVESVARTIGDTLDSDKKIVVNKSTSPVGTGKRVYGIIAEQLKSRGKSVTFSVASNPEFLREGTAIDDFMRPDRIVIGASDDYASEELKKLYSPLVKNGHPIFVTDLASAELSKYASNAFLATKISFINEIATICDHAGANVEEVRKIMCADKRIGHHFLYPGVGYGGSCFPKDVLGLVSIAKNYGHEAVFVSAVHNVNKKQHERFFEKIKTGLSPLAGKTIAIWGLSFKPHTDDMREAPSAAIVKNLIEAGATVRVYDPVATKEAKKIFGDGVLYATDMYHCADGADALAVITEWPQFKEPDFERLRGLLKNPVLFDGRNIYSPERMRELKFTYVSVGRAKVSPDIA
jgi:UDPglucose 6-dehydrogenase